MLDHITLTGDELRKLSDGTFSEIMLLVRKRAPTAAPISGPPSAEVLPPIEQLTKLPIRKLGPQRLSKDPIVAQQQQQAHRKITAEAVLELITKRPGITTSSIREKLAKGMDRRVAVSRINAVIETLKRNGLAEGRVLSLAERTGQKDYRTWHPVRAANGVAQH